MLLCRWKPTTTATHRIINQGSRSMQVGAQARPHPSQKKTFVALVRNLGLQDSRRQATAEEEAKLGDGRLDDRDGNARRSRRRRSRCRIDASIGM